MLENQVELKKQVDENGVNEMYYVETYDDGFEVEFHQSELVDLDEEESDQVPEDKELLDQSNEGLIASDTQINEPIQEPIKEATKEKVPEDIPHLIEQQLTLTDEEKLTDSFQDETEPVEEK